MDISILRCPCVRRETLHVDGDDLACPCRTFDSLIGQPVLIDFDRSIVDQESLRRRGGGGLGPRRARESHPLRNFIWGGNSRAPVMAQKFSDLVDGTILVVGGGTAGGGTEKFTDDVIAFDIYPTEITDFVADGHHIPLADGVVGGVWIQAVLEHVLDPAEVVAEIYRVLKPGGLIYADTPFMQPVHEAAFDFTRFSRSGHRWLFRRFEEIESGASIGVGAATVLSLRHFFRVVFRRKRIGSVVAAFFFWLRFIDKIRPAGYDAAGGFYFLGRKSDATLSPQDMVSYYRDRGPLQD